MGNKRLKVKKNKGAIQEEWTHKYLELQKESTEGGEKWKSSMKSFKKLSQN